MTDMAQELRRSRITSEAKADAAGIFVEVEKSSAPDPTEEAAELEAEKKILRKTDLKLVPVLLLLIFMAFLDRTNIGNARILGMDGDLGMTGSDYNIALFVFFIPYITLDTPANLLMKKLRPSLYLSTLVFCWGVVTIGQGLTKSYTGVSICRVLLGIFEAGYFPGALYLLSVYYTRYELNTRVNLWYSASVLSIAFGGLMAYGIGHMDGVGGYLSWRWVFILEGIFTVLTAVVAILTLPDWPEQAKFLTEEEKRTLLRKLARDTKDYVEIKSTRQVLEDCVRDPKLFLCSFMYLPIALTGAATAYFLPTILVQLGWKALKAQFMSIQIHPCSLAASIASGYLSDRFKIRSLFVIIPSLASIIGYSILIAQSSVSVSIRYMALFFVTSGCFASIGVTVSWLNNNIVGHKRRGISTAVLLAIGNCGSIVGSNVYLAREAPSYITGYSVSIAGVVLALLCAAGYLYYCWHENKQKSIGARDHLLSLSPKEQNELADKHPNYRYTY